MSEENNEKPPTELYRLETIRPIDIQTAMEITHVQFFHTRKSASERAAWVKSRGGKVISITRYIMEQKPRRCKDSYKGPPPGVTKPSKLPHPPPRQK